jgi:hypothetical protein
MRHEGFGAVRRDDEYHRPSQVGLCVNVRFLNGPNCDGLLVLLSYAAVDPKKDPSPPARTA